MKLLVFTCKAEDEGQEESCISFWSPASIAEAAVVVPYGAKIFFANGTTISLMELLICLIMNLKILQIELF